MILTGKGSAKKVLAAFGDAETGDFGLAEARVRIDQ